MNIDTLSQLSADLQHVDSNAFSSGLMLVGPLAIIGLVAVIMAVMGKISGWGRLAERYTASGVVPGNLHRFRSARIGWAGYNNCLTFGGDMRGLYVAMFPLFRPGHPPLYIPWHDLEAYAGDLWVVSYLEFRFPQMPGVRLRVSRSLGDSLIREAAGQVVIQEEEDDAGSQESTSSISSIFSTRN
jgi:hypothetical protein